MWVTLIVLLGGYNMFILHSCTSHVIQHESSTSHYACNLNFEFPISMGAHTRILDLLATISRIRQIYTHVRKTRSTDVHPILFQCRLNHRVMQQHTIQYTISQVTLKSRTTTMINITRKYWRHESPLTPMY